MRVLQNVRCIPASDVSASEAAFQGVTVTSLADHPVVTWPSFPGYAAFVVRNLS